jgi:hypothetical protein
MADDVKKVEIAIEASYDGRGAQQAVADQEKLTNTGKGLATTLPDLNAATKAYVISTEEEYVQIQKAHAALVAKIPTLQAAGKDTATYQTALENLSNALSTNEALTIAEAMETKAMAAAKGEAAIASRANAAATAEETAATGMNATSMREVLTIIRELEAGRLTRVPGSLSILLQQFAGIGPMLQAGMIAGSAAAFILFDVVKGIHQEWVKIGEEIAKAGERAAVPEFIQSIEKQRDAIAGAAADMQGFVDALAAAAEKETNLNAQLQQELGLLQAIERARAALTSAQKELDIARIQREESTGQITPEQAAEARAEIEKKSIAQAQQDRERAQDEDLNSRQVALKAAQDQQAGLNAQFAAASAKVQADKAHVDHVTVDPKALIEEIQAQEQKVSRLQGLMKGEGSGFGGSLTQDELAEMVAARNTNLLPREESRLAMLEKQFQQFQSTQSPEAAAQRKSDEDAANKAKQQAEDNAKLIGDLTKQVTDLKAEISKVRPVEEQTAATKAATVDEQEGGRIAQQFQSDAKVISEFDRSKLPSPELISRAAQAIQDMQGILKDHADLLKNIANLGPILSDLKSAIARAKNAADNQF